MLVVQELAHHPLISHFLRYTSTTMGRDKIYRIIQYFARFYAFYLLRQGAPKDTIVPWNSLKTNLALGRKLMRVGKNVEHVRAAAQAVEGLGKGGGGDVVGKALQVGRQVGYAGYLTFDIMQYLHGAGFIQHPNIKRIADNAYKCWLTGLTFNIIHGLYKLRQISSQRAALTLSPTTAEEEKTDVKKLDRESNAASYQLLQDLLDVTIPGSGLGLLPLDDGVVGVAGVVSSILGAKTQWKKTA
ncbi:hypothetical protein YB2330_001262 [Saitoella coloradoensis]